MRPIALLFLVVPSVSSLTSCSSPRSNGDQDELVSGVVGDECLPNETSSCRSDLRCEYEIVAPEEVSWACAPHGEADEGDACTASADCGPGLECVDGQAVYTCQSLDGEPIDETQCTSDGDCASTARCAHAYAISRCLPRCTSDADCDEGLTCASHSVAHGDGRVPDVFAVCVTS